MAALRELIDFAGPVIYQVRGSVFFAFPGGRTDLRNQASNAAHAAADDATVQKALAGADPILVFWGIWHFQGLKDQPAVLPLLERIAQGKEESLRAQAVEALRQNGDWSFVRGLAQSEKSPYVLDNILYQGNPGGAAAFNQRLCDLLRDPDPAVRNEVVSYIGFNWISAAARQMILTAPVMDALLACAQPGHPGANAALDTFRTYANQKSLPTVAATATWWNANRTDWEQARFPRGEPTNGGNMYASIVTRGTVGRVPGWQASIILENHRRDYVYVNLAEIASVRWFLYDAAGEIVPIDTKAPEALPRWIDMQPGQTVSEVAPINLEAGGPLAPGRYTLHAWMFLGSDTRDMPPNVALLSVEIPFPAITVEVRGPPN